MKTLEMIWEMDVSCPNLVLADGKRAAVITCTDTASRRVVSHVADAVSDLAIFDCLQKAIKVLGTPETVITDNRKAFSSCSLSHMFQAMGITHTRKSLFTQAESQKVVE
jgi:Integrase core domain.